MNTSALRTGASSVWSDVVAALEEPRRATIAPVAIGQRRRRGYDTAAGDGRATVELIRDGDGLLRWVYTPPPLGGGAGRRAYRSLHIAKGDVVEQFRFNDLGRNEVTDKLVGLDASLTPAQGMRRWRHDEAAPADASWPNGRFVDDAHPQVDTGRVLLLVHGTFSKSEMWPTELQATAQGQQLLGQWAGRYSAVLAFSHPTLSVGAWSNAIDLNRALRDVKVPIDVVCHSRGGLVVSWLLRLNAVQVERVVFVGSPLVGTSLAAPDKLRAALDLLANYADAVSLVGGAAASLMPLAAGVAGLAKILGKTLRLGSGLPILDAAVALVPGLATQQAVGNNLDLRQLFADDWMRRPDMTSIGVAFRPDENKEPLWKFWKRFTNIGDQVKYGAADLVFPGPNDLVVDVNSMFRLGEAANIAFEDLGVSPKTHHTNYFRDGKVLDYLDKRLT